VFPCVLPARQSGNGDKPCRCRSDGSPASLILIAQRIGLIPAAQFIGISVAVALAISPKYTLRLIAINIVSSILTGVLDLFGSSDRYVPHLPG
jgi:hypothetical protein